MQTKQCTKCHRTKPLVEFRRDSRKRDGRRSQCRECQRSDDREQRAGRRAAGKCQQFGCPSPAAPGRGGRCDSHADENSARRAATRAADPAGARERWRDYARAYRARLSSRSDAEIEADLAHVLAESPDGLLPCRAGHRAVAEEFGLNRVRRSGRHDYCRAHDVERVARRHSDARTRLIARWAERDLYRCYITGADFEDEGPHALHVDHQWSLARGGPDVEENLFPATAAANLSKSKRPFHDVIEEHHPGVLAAVADWPRVVIDLDTGEVLLGDEDAAEFVAPLLGEEA